MHLDAESEPDSDVHRELMIVATIVVDSNGSTTTVTIVRSMALTSAPVIDVRVCRPLSNGSQKDTLSDHCLAVVVECGVEPWVPEGVDHVFISHGCLWYRGGRADRRISKVGFRRSSILDSGGEGVKECQIPEYFFSR